MAATLTDELSDWFDLAPVHVVVSVAFLGYLPHYNLTPLAKDAFWVVVGKLAERDDRGRYVHMQGPGEIKITQDNIAKQCRVSRQATSGAMTQLMDRAFLWKAGRGAYQIHPHLLYFGSAEKQAEAIGYAGAKRRDGQLPPVPKPGVEIVIMNTKGVKTITA
ncbi:replication/maintenance protein RepL [Streptomyces andamanensis]|uniref:Replication/maintenance protein RepL n=1 Tax=Streptomyces andamanensis TaxID=1565035 RepID=A0ABV8TCB9_9ACTN